MTKIKYLVGDATEPVINRTEPKIICHVCNDIGGWGRGFVLAISKKWENPEKEYRKWAEEEYPNFELGQVQVVEVEQDLFVANMIAQHGVQWIGSIPPIRYDRVRQCLTKLAVIAKKLNASIHCPRFGAGLAGGTWKVIEGLIEETIIKENIEVFVYDLKD